MRFYVVRSIFGTGYDVFDSYEHEPIRQFVRESNADTECKLLNSFVNQAGRYGIRPCLKLISNPLNERE